ncbi:MAG: hypothetical protein WD036_05505 [Bauldia sp.]
MAVTGSTPSLVRTFLRAGRRYFTGWRRYWLPLAFLAGCFGAFTYFAPGVATAFGAGLTATIERTFRQFVGVGHGLAAEVSRCRFDLRLGCITYPTGFEGFDPWRADSVPPRRLSNQIGDGQICAAVRRLIIPTYTLEDYQQYPGPTLPEPHYDPEVTAYRCAPADSPAAANPSTSVLLVDDTVIDDRFECYALDRSPDADGWNVMCHPTARAPWWFFGGTWDSHAVAVADDSGLVRRTLSAFAHLGEKLLGLLFSLVNISGGVEEQLDGLAKFVFVALLVPGIILCLWLLSASMDRIGVLGVVVLPFALLIGLTAPVAIIAALGVVFELLLKLFGATWAGVLFTGFVVPAYQVYGAFIGPFKAVFRLASWRRRLPRPDRGGQG